jgi:two-component system, LuxR family, response regulator FixJ
MAEPIVFVVDDDADVRESLQTLLEASGFQVQTFDSAGNFLTNWAFDGIACLIADIRMPDMDGLQLQEELVRRRAGLPVIIVTGHGDVPLAVRAMKAGAIDFLEKPFDEELLLTAVRRARAAAEQARSETQAGEQATRLIEQLTPRERDVLKRLVAGRPNKVIAYELSISPRTVEIHRAHLMDKMHARSLSDLIRAALAAGFAPGPEK